jgi:hypothetical protein
MRGRSSVYLLRLAFGGWALPKKNKRRRLAAQVLQRRWRGQLGRRAANYRRAAARQREARVVELASGGPRRARRRCFAALQAWPQRRPGYDAATQCQRRARGLAGRRRARALRTEFARAKASLAQALGFGRANTLRRCFRALRWSGAAKDVQRAWRSNVARAAARETLARLKQRKVRVRQLMRRLLGPVATRAL